MAKTWFLLHLGIVFTLLLTILGPVCTQPNYYTIGNAVIVRSQGPLAVYCHPCQRTFTTPRYLATHRRAVHRFPKPRVWPFTVQQHPWLTGTKLLGFEGRLKLIP
jgi:hypothetical protein